MIIMRHFALVAVLAVAIPAIARAGVFGNNPPSYQGHPRAMMGQASLVRVKPGARAYFYWNVVYPGCPALTPACRQRSYLVPGDIAVAAYTMGAFTVVDFVGQGGAVSTGAIESRLIERITTPHPAVPDWVGHWQSGKEADIVISRTRSPAVLAFLGNATWGAGDPERVKRGGIHTGAFAAYVKPVAEWGGFDHELNGEYASAGNFPALTAQPGLDTDWAHSFPKDVPFGECRASFRLLGPYLLTYTPVNGCGGFNVTFTGVYRQVARHHE